MRKMRWVWAAVLLLPVFFGTHCAEGETPETVVVPVGEPDYGGDDPYDSGGDLGCGSETGAITADAIGGEDGWVAIVFVGERDVWAFMLSADETTALRVSLSDYFPGDTWQDITRRDVDALHAELCASPGERTERAGALRALFGEVLGERMAEMSAEACED
ncbi:hypothetical protein K8I61_00355 [bacterium]|nr:hypothetical protein [bacterium]